MAYAQLISMQHIQSLGKLADQHAKAQPRLDPNEVFGAEDSLSFNWDAERER